MSLVNGRSERRPRRRRKPNSLPLNQIMQWGKQQKEPLKLLRISSKSIRGKWGNPECNSAVSSLQLHLDLLR